MTPEYPDIPAICVKRKSYSLDIAVREVDMTEYVARFRNSELFIQYCRECQNFGRSWACPPFDFNVDDMLRRFSRVSLLASRFVPYESCVDIDIFRDTTLTDCKHIEEFLLNAESESGGRAFINIGRCHHCGADSCRRISGNKCLHPDKVRPSLEAYGFDVSRTLSDLFGLELKWSDNGMTPDYLVLVTGLFHGDDYRVKILSPKQFSLFDD